MDDCFFASWRCNEVAHVFYTEKVISAHKQNLEEYETIEVLRMDVNDCIRRINKNELQDSELIFAVLQLLLRGYLKV